MHYPHQLVELRASQAGDLAGFVNRAGDPLDDGSDFGLPDGGKNGVISNPRFLFLPYCAHHGGRHDLTLHRGAA